MTKEKLLESYRKGWKIVYDKCGFETIMATEKKIIRFNKYEFPINAGIHHLNVDDETLAKWLAVNQLVYESGMITGEELIKIITEGCSLSLPQEELDK